MFFFADEVQKKKVVGNKYLPIFCMIQGLFPIYFLFSLFCHSSGKLFMQKTFVRFLMKNDGLFLGSSSAMNCVGAVRVAQSIGPGHTIVTILCDSGMRHLSKFYNADYLSKYDLTPSCSGLEFLGIE